MHPVIEDGQRVWYTNPGLIPDDELRMNDRCRYVCSISGCSWVTMEWFGVLGWMFVSRD